MAAGTFFAEIHQELNAKTAPCGKWNLPLFYPGGSAAEHRHTLSEASLFDQTGCRIFQLTGKGIGTYLDEVFLYAVATLPVGGCMENFLLHDDGTFAALFTLCRMQDEDFMLLAERDLPEKEIAYLLKTIGQKVCVRELSEAMAVLTMAGARTMELLSAAGAAELPACGSWQLITVLDDEGDELRAIAIRRDRFGVTGFDLCINSAVALEFYGALYRIAGVAPAGVTAWESLRIESGTVGVGTELHSGILPTECGIGPDMTRRFVGKDALTQAVSTRQLVMLRFDRYPAAPGSAVQLPDQRVAGVVTSGAFCPAAGEARVFAFLDADCPAPSGAEFFCTVNGKNTCGTILAAKAR